MDKPGPARLHRDSVKGWLMTCELCPRLHQWWYRYWSGVYAVKNHNAYHAALEEER